MFQLQLFFCSIVTNGTAYIALPRHKFVTGATLLQLAPSNGNGPTDPLHISCICSIWKILHFYSSLSLNPSKSAFFHAVTVSLLPKNHILFIFSKQCACSRRVHIECHMNRFEYCHPDNNSDNDSFGSFLSKNRIFCNITRC